MSAWRLVTHRDDRGTALYRVRLALPQRPDLAAFVHAVVIRWPYAAADASPDHHLGAGFPDASVNAAQLKFETALDPLMCGEEAELMGVTTGRGVKEWLYYTRDREEFLARYSALLSDLHGSAPVYFAFENDVKWTRWFNTLKSIVKSAATG